jgi:hypothetical protein
VSASLHFAVRRVQVDNDELEPNITAGDLEVIDKRRREGSRQDLGWVLTLLTADESWQHGLGECQVVIDVAGERRFRGRAVLFRSDRGRWHYFQGEGKLEGFNPSDLESPPD